MIGYMIPDGAGYKNDWNAQGAATLWAAVSVDDGDTSYARGFTNNTWFDVALSAPPSPIITLYGATGYARVRGDGAGEQAKAILSTSAVNASTGAAVVLTTSYQTASNSTSPSGSWTTAVLPGLAAGAQCLGGETYYKRCTRVWVEVSYLGPSGGCAQIISEIASLVGACLGLQHMPLLSRVAARKTLKLIQPQEYRLALREWAEWGNRKSIILPAFAPVWR